MRIVLGLTIFSLPVFFVADAQTTPTRNDGTNFRASVQVTNNGISLLPTFSLGKPAAQFDLSLFGKRMGFEPQIRYSLKGKPWSYIFWWRYKVIKREKFFLNVGAHPALVFRELSVTTNGVTRDYVAAQRYVAAEISPNYRVSGKVTVGLYYLRGHGLDRGSVTNTHFLTANSTLNNLRLAKGVYLRFTPQFYYLKQAANSGFYVSTAAALYSLSSPWSIGAVTNHIIDTQIPGSKRLVWNISLGWAVSANYDKRIE